MNTTPHNKIAKQQRETTFHFFSQTMSQVALETNISRSLKQDKLHTFKRATMQNACWESSRQSLVSGRDTQEPIWPLPFALKEQTRQALFREFGLPMKPSRECTHVHQNKRGSLDKLKSRLTGRTSSNALLKRVNSRMRLHEATTTTTIQSLGGDSKSMSTPNCGLRRSPHLLTVRPATVVSLQSMKRNSVFRKALQKQQQQQQHHS